MSLLPCHFICISRVDRSTAIPGGADRAAAAGRLRMYFTVSALVGGFAASVMFMYRSMFRSGGSGIFSSSQVGIWLGWLFGRRDM